MKTIRLSVKLARELRAVIADCGKWGNIHPGLAASLLGSLDDALKPPRSRAPSQERLKAKKQSRKEEWAAIKAVVLKRAAGICEACGNPSLDTLNCDHMFGGHGRRLTLQSPQTVWALCGPCDANKTRNHPNAFTWLAAFRNHAQHYGFHAAARIAEARMDSLEIQGRAG